MGEVTVICPLVAEVMPPAYYSLTLLPSGSALGTLEGSDGQYFPNAEITNLDLVPTLAALLGVGVPAHSEGVFVDTVLHHLQPNTKTLRLLFRYCSRCSVLAKSNVYHIP